MKTRPKSGKPRKISRRQEANLRRTLVKINPKNPWTTKRVSGLIAKKTAVNYSQRQIKRILNRWNFGLSAGRPIYWKRASEEEIKSFGKKSITAEKSILNIIYFVKMNRQSSLIQSQEKFGC